MKKHDPFGSVDPSPTMKSPNKRLRLLSPKQALSPLNTENEGTHDNMRTPRIISPLDNYSPSKKNKVDKHGTFGTAMRTVEEDLSRSRNTNLP